jgi:DNA-binding transcriptional regulator YdaS (Cro superfamily)
MFPEVCIFLSVDAIDTAISTYYDGCMDLKNFVKSLPQGEREHFALEAGTTPGHLRNVMYGYSLASPAVAVSIERLSDGQVTRQELRPDDWADIWPELAQAKRPARARQQRVR